MKNFWRGILGMLCVSGLVACSKPTPQLLPGASAQFSVGDVWTYRTRPGEENSVLVVGKIDHIRGENIIHIKIAGVSIKNSLIPGGVQTELYHSPIAETALAKSVISKSNVVVDLKGFQEGYDQWLSGFNAGKAGWFTLSVAEILDLVEKTVAKSAP